MTENQCIAHTLDKIGGRWKIMILWELRLGPLRFGDLKEKVEGITQKMLSQSLQEMMKDGLMTRKSYPQIPPRVEYKLTDEGISLLPVMEAVYRWGAAKNGIIKDQMVREYTAPVKETTVETETTVAAEPSSVEIAPIMEAPIAAVPRKPVAKKAATKEKKQETPQVQQLGLF